MRIYRDWTEAISEIKRDLVEMGIRVHPQTYQDKDISKDPNFETMELQNYIYTVQTPLASEIPELDIEYCTKEWADRRAGFLGFPSNPGESYKLHPEIWTEFLMNGKFAYTYSERLALNNQCKRVLQRLREDPDSRQGYITIWNPKDVYYLGGVSRVPCSLGYLVQIRNNHVNLTYLQRSCDFVTHFKNDAALATAMLQYFKDEMFAYDPKYKLGNLTHWIGSLHIFKKDGEGVF